MAGQHPRALLFTKNSQTARRLSRVLCGAGYEVEIPEGGALQEPQRGGNHAWPVLLIAEAALAAELPRLLRPPDGGPDGLRQGIVLQPLGGGAEEADPAGLLAEPAVCAVLGGRAPEQPLSELMAVAAHLRGLPLLPMQAHLMWGTQAYSTEVGNLAGREAATAHVVALLAEKLLISRRIADAAGEVVHELLTNAMYDAPVDAAGRQRYAQDRTAPIELPPGDRAIFRYGTDGVRLAVEVEDRFGRLTRADLCRSLQRGAAGQVNHEAGGAGIGLSLVQRHAQLLQIDVSPGRRTRVTAVLELEPQRAPGGEAVRPARSLVFPCLGPAFGPGSTAGSGPRGSAAS